jgi:hypothetical protein
MPISAQGSTVGDPKSGAWSRWIRRRFIGESEWRSAAAVRDAKSGACLPVDWQAIHRRSRVAERSDRPGRAADNRRYDKWLPTT